MLIIDTRVRAAGGGSGYRAYDQRVGHGPNNISTPENGQSLFSGNPLFATAVADSRKWIREELGMCVAGGCPQSVPTPEAGPMGAPWDGAIPLSFQGDVMVAEEGLEPPTRGL